MLEHILHWALFLLSTVGIDATSLTHDTTVTKTETVRLSVYRPGDGMNRGVLACGGAFTSTQVHVAIRGWHRVGCGRQVVVSSRATGRSVLATVMDAGPFGIVPVGSDLYRPKAWRRHTRGRMPVGWQYRAGVDLSWGLWVALGKPPFLTDVRLEYKSRRPRQAAQNSRLALFFKRMLERYINRSSSAPPVA